jgi:hypothetical protein
VIVTAPFVLSRSVPVHSGAARSRTTLWLAQDDPDSILSVSTDDLRGRVMLMEWAIDAASRTASLYSMEGDYVLGRTTQFAPTRTEHRWPHIVQIPSVRQELSDSIK